MRDATSCSTRPMSCCLTIGTAWTGWVPLRIVRPPTAPTAATAAAATQMRLPAVILLHQTGGCKETMLQMQMEYARGGYVCAAMDSRSVRVVWTGRLARRMGLCLHMDGGKGWGG
eukprot:365159-Chlamydomonas_euryale.AAC.11